MVKAGKELHPQPADELHRAHREPLEGPHEQRQLRVVFGKALVLLLQPLRAEDYQDYQSVTLCFQLIHLGRGARILPGSERGRRKGRVGWERGGHQGQQCQWDDSHLVATAPQMWDGPEPDGRRKCLFGAKRAMRRCGVLRQAGSAVFL